MKNDMFPPPADEPRPQDDPTLPPLAAAIIAVLKTRKRQTIADLLHDHTLRRGSRSAIKKHLHTLVAAGHVRQHGLGKSTWYTL